MRRRKTDVEISTIRDGRTRPIDVGVLAGILWSRLSGLALLSIESKVARSLNLDDLIKNFASMKVRRKKVVY